MMKMRLVLFISAFLLMAWNVQAQEGVCGTEVTPAQITLENSIAITPVKPNESPSQLNLEISVTVYVIKDEHGADGITLAAINAAFDRLNAAFLPVKLKLRICNTLYIENYQFNTINALQNERDLTIKHYSPNTVNLYFASVVIDKTGNNVSGYTHMPAEQNDFIFLKKNSISGCDIIHQFGHFFNLYHTHETVFGNELVKDSNCSKTGDRCCDTPADPGIAGMIDEKCDYTGSAKDVADAFYIPATNNFMSVGNGNCRCIFTNDQYERLVHSIKNQKKHLW